jgi:DNA modification methylase
MVKGVVYDIFSGIATTARSAEKLNRDYIGSDISQEYHNIAKKLMEKEDGEKEEDKK